VAKQLVKNGANVSTESDTEGNGLHYACAAGDFSLAKWLVKLGLNPNEKSNAGVKPINLANSTECPELVEWLLAWTLAHQVGKSVNVVLSEMKGKVNRGKV
jgi:ankyrin repeat protein